MENSAEHHKRLRLQQRIYCLFWKLNTQTTRTKSPHTNWKRYDDKRQTPNRTSECHWSTLETVDCRKRGVLRWAHARAGGPSRRCDGTKESDSLLSFIFHLSTIAFCLVRRCTHYRSTSESISMECMGALWRRRSDAFNAPSAIVCFKCLPKNNTTIASFRISWVAPQNCVCVKLKWSLCYIFASVSSAEWRRRCFARFMNFIGDFNWNRIRNANF